MLHHFKSAQPGMRAVDFADRTSRILLLAIALKLQLGRANDGLNIRNSDEQHFVPARLQLARQRCHRIQVPRHGQTHKGNSHSSLLRSCPRSPVSSRSKLNGLSSRPTERNLLHLQTRTPTVYSLLGRICPLKKVQFTTLQAEKYSRHCREQKTLFRGGSANRPTKRVFCLMKR